MGRLFSPGRLGTLECPNRLVRSATAECLADEYGRPRPALKDLYRKLAQGGVGLIITGHMFVHPAGRAHATMTGIHDDVLIPLLAELTDAVHRERGRLVAQINHGGMQCAPEAVPSPLAPSAVDFDFLPAPARAMSRDDIGVAIAAYAQAARRAREAGFDGVQVHAAHGYLISQFLSPLVNHRTDGWGGTRKRRMRFLSEVCRAIRAEVGRDYPVLIKLGMKDAVPGGLTVDEGVEVVAALAEMGFDGVEISGGMAGGTDLNVRRGVSNKADEAYFRPLAMRARAVTRLPIILVGGFRSQAVMEEVLASGDADFVSLCRPLICEPDFPNRLREGLQERSACVSENRCWPEGPNEGIACKCPKPICLSCPVDKTRR